MKTIILISALLFTVLSTSAQTKTPATPPPAAPKPVPTFSIKGLHEQEVQNIFEICTLLKQSVPYNTKITDGVKNAIQLNVDAFTSFLTAKITQDDTTKKVTTDTSKNKAVKVKKPKS